MSEIPQPLHPVIALRAAILAHGLQPVAVYTHDKRPFGNHWQATHGHPPFVAQAQSTGILCNGVRAVDVDVSDPRAAAEAEDVIFETLGVSTFIRGRSDSPRRLILYRGTGKKRIIKTNAGEVEILGEGQQFVAYGVHPDGADYEWLESEPASQKVNGSIVKDEDLDRLEAALHAALGGFPTEKGGEATEGNSSTPDIAPVARRDRDRGATTWAEKALADECARVASAGKGGRNQAINDAAFNLGQIVGGGLLNRADVENALRNAARACGYPQADGWRQTNATIKSGLESGLKQPRKPPAIEPSVPVAVVEAAELMTRPRAREANDDPLAAIEMGRNVDWRTPRGLIGRISDWILETSPRPNKPLAVAAATSILSAICGRHLYSPTGAALNVYIVMLAKTGAGKDRPLSAVGEFFRAAQLAALAQTAKAFSVSGFEKLVRDNPCCVATIDEMGANLLARIANKRASHEAGEGIKAALQELWSRFYGKSPFATTTRAQAASDSVASPSLTLIGASTPEKFYECFKAGDALSGFLNRFLIVNADGRAKETHEFEYVAPSPEIVEELRALIPEQDGNLGDVMGVYRAPAVTERKMRWEDAETKAEARALENQIGEMADVHPHGELMARTFEYAIRLASLHAISNARLAVDRHDLAWGASWSIQSTRGMIVAANEMMAETDHEGFVNRIKAIIKKEGTIGRTDLARRTQWLKSKDRDGIIDQLAEAEIIQKLDVKSGQPGPVRRCYRWMG